jgi:hemoglobin-like flavoprotein
MSAPRSIDAESLNAAHASYECAAEKPEFYAGFYANFFQVCPDARPKFAKTDFERQHKLLHHAIGMLLIYPKHEHDEPNLLSRLARRHGRKDLDIPASMYRPFVDALVMTLRQCDPSFNDQIEAAWRAILSVGVAYMQSKY